MIYCWKAVPLLYWYFQCDALNRFCFALLLSPPTAKWPINHQCTSYQVPVSGYSLLLLLFYGSDKLFTWLLSWTTYLTLFPQLENETFNYVVKNGKDQPRLPPNATFVCVSWKTIGIKREMVYSSTLFGKALL